MNKLIPVVLIVGVAAVLAYLFIFSEPATGEIPAYVTGELRDMYAWAKTPEGAGILEQLPCYCGCKYEGHLHSRHCFWRDDGTFDKHGITCSVCQDIARKAMQMVREGSSVCDMRNDVDTFYYPNRHLGTPTPMPEGCTSSIGTPGNSTSLAGCTQEGCSL